MEKWKLYWGSMPLPTGATALGVVDLEDGRAGALIELPTGLWMGNAGTLSRLSDQEAKLARSKAGAIMGSVKSELKAKTSAENKRRSLAEGKNPGGRPKGSKNPPKENKND